MGGCLWSTDFVVCSYSSQAFLLLVRSWTARSCNNQSPPWLLWFGLVRVECHWHTSQNCKDNCGDVQFWRFESQTSTMRRPREFSFFVCTQWILVTEVQVSCNQWDSQTNSLELELGPISVWHILKWINPSKFSVPMAACLKDWIMSADKSEDEEKVLLGLMAEMSGVTGRW